MGPEPRKMKVNSYRVRAGPAKLGNEKEIGNAALSFT